MKFQQRAKTKKNFTLKIFASKMRGIFGRLLASMDDFFTELQIQNFLYINPFVLCVSCFVACLHQNALCVTGDAKIPSSHCYLLFALCLFIMLFNRNWVLKIVKIVFFSSLSVFYWYGLLLICNNKSKWIKFSVWSAEPNQKWPSNKFVSHKWRRISYYKMPILLMNRLHIEKA